MRATLFVRNKMRKPIIKKGDKYNFLTAIKFDHMDGHGNAYWLFKCDCGNESVAQVNNVKRGAVKSCGCLLKKIHITHGMTNTFEYNAWHHMKQRCINKSNHAYKNYGGRGITICKRWLNFENFYKDMGKRPRGMSLDRVDNNKGYYKENCRWATVVEQNNNMRSNHFLTYNGETQTIAWWVAKLGINRGTLYSRIYRGWSIERAFTTKV